MINGAEINMIQKIKDAISVRFEQFVMHFPCEYCGEPGKEIEIDVPTQPQSGGYGASFKGGKDIVTYCNECADSELDYCGECGIIARNDNIAIYGCKCKNV